uniref:Uncharacterized protein n=1 Tax=Haptolina brevifila TaxID=156173 RepID=A0A7S2GQ23_9EUKA
MEEAECSSLLHDMEEAECFDPLVFFTSANVTDLEDLSSAPSLQKATTMRTANVLEIPDVQTDRNARENSPTEDATQKGSPCPSPSFLSAEADGTQSSDVPNSDADHPSDDLSLLVREDSDEPLEMLHFDDISSIMSGEDGDEPLDLSPTDDIVNGTDRDADQSGEQSQVDEMPQLNSSASTFQMLSFEAGQKDVLSSESLSESGELIDAVPSIADAGTSSSAQPLKSPPQQTDIVRMLNGEIPLKGDQEEMDLLMQMTQLPPGHSIFDSILMPEGLAPTSLRPKAGKGKGSKRGASMPPLAPTPKRAICNAKGVPPRLKAQWAKNEWKKELPEKTKSPIPAKAPAMWNQARPSLPTADAPSAQPQLATPLPTPMPSHSSVQFLTSYVPPSLMTADGMKTANAYPQMPQTQMPQTQMALNSAGQYIPVAAIHPGMDMTRLSRPEPPRSMGKQFIWQSLQVLSNK